MRILLLLKVFRLRSGQLDAHRLWRSTAVIGNKPPDQKDCLPKRVKLSFDDPEIAYTVADPGGAEGAMAPPRPCENRS